MPEIVDVWVNTKHWKAFRVSNNNWLFKTKIICFGVCMTYAEVKNMKVIMKKLMDENAYYKHFICYLV